MTAEAFECNPMIVEAISATTMQACLIAEPTRSLRTCGVPYAALYGSADEIFHVPRLAALVPLDDPHTQRLLVLDGATHFSLLHDARMHTALAAFIRAQLADTPGSPAAPPPPPPPAGPPSSFRFLDRSGAPSTRLICQFAGSRTASLEIVCSQPSMDAGILYLLPDPAAAAAGIESFSQQFPFAVFKLVPGGLPPSGTPHGPLDAPAVYEDIARVARLLRCNRPGMPIFLAGAGHGASLALNFAAWAQDSPVTGYILLAPIPDPGVPGNQPAGPPALRRPGLLDSVRALFARGRASTAPRAGAWEDRLAPALLVGSLPAAVERVAAPFLLLLPEHDELTDAGRICAQLQRHARPPFQRIEQAPGTTRGDLCTRSLPAIGRWVLQAAATSASLAQAVLPAGLAIGAFEPVALIGRGSYGHVWLAQHRASGRHLAVKIQEKARNALPGLVRQAVRELAVLRHVQMPFAPHFLAAFQDPARLYLVMEFVVGGELLRRIQDAGKMANDEARFYAAEIVAALDHLHGHRIAYRDLKPENVLLDLLGHVRLIDFGYARPVAADGRCGSFCGSPYYLAPELLRHGVYDGRRADIWSLGALIYEMLAGRPPFLGKSARSVYARILLEEPAYPAGLEDDALDLLRAMLCKDPAARIDSIAAVKRHRWFKNLDWELVAARRLVPPHQPAYCGDNDTSNYMQFQFDPAEFFHPPERPVDAPPLPDDAAYEGF